VWPRRRQEGRSERVLLDRILAAQALVEEVPLVTNDPAFAAFGVKVVW